MRFEQLQAREILHKNLFYIALNEYFNETFFHSFSFFIHSFTGECWSCGAICNWNVNIHVIWSVRSCVRKRAKGSNIWGNEMRIHAWVNVKMSNVKTYKYEKWHIKKLILITLRTFEHHKTIYCYSYFL